VKGEKRGATAQRLKRSFVWAFAFLVRYLCQYLHIQRIYKDKKMVQERSKQNLVMWQKGQSGNPAGRPPGAKSFRKIVEKFLEQETTFEDENGEPQQLTRREAGVLSLVIASYKDADPNVRIKALETILNRLEGKPPTQGQEQGSDGNEGSVFASLPTERKAEVLRLLGIKTVQQIDITPHEELDTDADQ
jgi:hypothetical protein